MKPHGPIWASLCSLMFVLPLRPGLAGNDGSTAPPCWAPSDAVHVVEDLDAPIRILTTCMARYPASAIRRRAQGEVVLSFTLGADGVPQRPKVISSPDSDLTQSALDSLSRWRFSRPMRDGRPVTVELAQPFQFSLSEHPASSSDPGRDGPLDDS